FESDADPVPTRALPCRRTAPARLRAAPGQPRRRAPSRGAAGDPQAARRLHRRLGRDRAGTEHTPARLGRGDRPAGPGPPGRSRGAGAGLPPRGGGAFADTGPPRSPRPPPPPRARGGPPGGPLGRCGVVLSPPRHEASFGGLSPAELGRVLAVWVDRSRELWS